MRFSEITFKKVKEEVVYYLKKTYRKNDVLFGPASPYGHILEIIEKLYATVLLYIKNVVAQYDLRGAASNNRKAIRTLVILGGHEPTRDISATGVIKMKVKPSVSVADDIPGAQVTIFNRTQIKNKTNNLTYTIDLGTEKATYNITNSTQFFFNVIQGKYEKQTFTGTGNINQSFSVNVPGINEVENFYFEISVNGKNWPIRKNLLDLLPEEEACVVRTGFEGGADVIFGNGGYGAVPPIGSIIEVVYILTDGERGNIFRKTPNDFKFIDDVFDGFGGTVSVDDVFDIFIEKDINFGAAGESIEFMKNLMPITSRNYVLALPDQFTYFIKRLGSFSRVTAWQSAKNLADETVYIYAVPDVRNFKDKDTDYFNVGLEAFNLDAYEKDKIFKYLKSQGTIALTRNVKIVDPVIKKYVMNVFLTIFDDAIEENVKSEIYNISSEFFLNNTRVDKIPSADLLAQLKTIKGIDSIEIIFVSHDNEAYHLNHNIHLKNVNTSRINILKFRPFFNYDPNLIIGLDPILGDILIKEGELPIIRGGWTDRNGIKYSETPTDEGYGPINTFIKGISRRNNGI
jgi:hypothetical protein